MKRKKIALASCFLICSGFVPPLLASGQSIHTYSNLATVGSWLIPNGLFQALNQGISLPLYLTYKDRKIEASDIQNGESKIAEVTLQLDKNQLLINDIRFTEQGQHLLSEKFRQELTKRVQWYFDTDQIIHLNDDAQIHLDIAKMWLTLSISKNEMGLNKIEKIRYLGHPSVNQLTNTTNYQVMLNDSLYKQHNWQNSHSAYLSLNDVLGYQENHLMLDGYVYASSSAKTTGDLYQAMFERDWRGKRLAFGAVSDAALQTLGSITTVSAGRIYGASYGNQSHSVSYNNNLSLSTITAFLPSAGQVRILKNNKVLSIQNYSMGSYELDTSMLPSGRYDVTVQVIVNGQVISTQQEHVNKLGNDFNNGNPFSWQIWGGLFRSRWQIDSTTVGGLKSKNTYIAGISLARIFDNLDGLSTNSTFYGFDHIGVMEANVTFPQFWGISFNTQSMVATDSSWRAFANVAFSFADKWPTFWVSYEKSKIGNQLKRYGTVGSDYISVGGSYSLSHILPLSGSINVSYNRDRFNKNHYYNINYYQNLLNSRYGNLGLSAGYERTFNGDMNAVADKYILLTYSIPLGDDLNLGLSYQQNRTFTNLGYQHNFDSGWLKSVNSNISYGISGESEDSGLGEWSVQSGASFELPVTEGNINIDGGENHFNTNLSAHGSIAVTPQHIALGSQTNGNAGVIIDTALPSGTDYVASLNGVPYYLSGKESYISLPSYQEYQLKIQNSDKSTDNVSIKAAHDYHFTLYPGNVQVISPQVHETITLFGHLVSPTGESLAQQTIIGGKNSVYSDDQGNFAIDVDSALSKLEVVGHNHLHCSLKIDLRNQHGVMWLGDQQCNA